MAVIHDDALLTRGLTGVSVLCETQGQVQVADFSEKRPGTLLIVTNMAGSEGDRESGYSAILDRDEVFELMLELGKAYASMKG